MSLDGTEQEATRKTDIAHARRQDDERLAAMQLDIASLQSMAEAVQGQLATITDFVEFWSETQALFRLLARFAKVLKWFAAMGAAIATVWGVSHVTEIKIDK